MFNIFKLFQKKNPVSQIEIPKDDEFVVKLLENINQNFDKWNSRIICNSYFLDSPSTTKSKTNSISVVLETNTNYTTRNFDIKCPVYEYQVDVNYTVAEESLKFLVNQPNTLINFHQIRHKSDLRKIDLDNKKIEETKTNILTDLGIK